MAVNLQAILDAPIIELDTIDSTNNYAMGLIDADTALPGLTVVAREQTAGKGQRGKQWQGGHSDSLLMSLIVAPPYSLEQQFTFSAAVAVSIANVLQKIFDTHDVRIKWPNDIIINDKKAGGILIENVIRGNNWSYSVVGLGLNLNQERFPDELPYATSLFIESGKHITFELLLQLLRNRMIESIFSGKTDTDIIKEYNDFLFRKDELQGFADQQSGWIARVLEVTSDGKLIVMKENGQSDVYTHGLVNWQWR